jgi:hypothetical protein
VALVTIDRPGLEALSREELVLRGRQAGVARPEVMTRVELVDEILRISVKDVGERRRVRGFLGVARDLVASIIEQGLNLPDAAALVRGEVRLEERPVPPPVATVTLAEIYAAQGHVDRALGILDEVLRNEPEHDVARRLRETLAAPLQEPFAAGPEARSVPPVAPDAPSAPDAPDAPDAPAPSASRSEVPAPDSIAPDVGAGDAPPVAPPLAVMHRSADASLTVAWELPGRGSHEALSVRVVEILPGPGGAKRLDHVLSGRGARGRLRVRLLDESALVRAAVGSTTEDAFRALAVAVEVAPTEDASAPCVVLWQPRRKVASLERLARVAGLA